MIPREDFVGTIRKEANGQELLLEEFMGEGSTAVVYAIKPVDEPGKSQTVMKFFKPQAFLEMSVLNHAFRIDKEMYPNHPLLMEPDERLRRLTEEMLTRLSSNGFEFRVTLYKKIMSSAVEGMARTYGKDFARGELSKDFLEDSQLKPRIDENFLYHIQELLEEDNITADYEPFFEFLASAVPEAITRWKASGSYHPFSSNALYNLLGLKLEDFIDETELDHIASQPTFQEKITTQALSVLWWLVTILYHRAAGLIQLLPSTDESNTDETADDSDYANLMSKYERDRQTYEITSCVDAGLIGCRLVDYFASQPEWQNKQLSGLARLWFARLLELLHENDEPRRLALESALTLLTEEDSIRDRHDVLLGLARIVHQSDPDRALAYLREAQVIEVKLNIPLEQRTREVV